jgi:hypothetical protein
MFIFGRKTRKSPRLALPCLAMCQLLYFSRNLFFNFPKINGNFKDSKKGKDLRSASEKQTVIFHN